MGESMLLENPGGRLRQPTWPTQLAAFEAGPKTSSWRGASPSGITIELFLGY